MATLVISYTVLLLLILIVLFAYPSLRVVKHDQFERTHHFFATVPEPERKGYSLVVSRAGDWTTKQIESPPTKLWVRGVPMCGVLRLVPLFRRLVFVATGSGIGPCAPCILEQRVPIRLLWTSPNVRKTFGNKLVDSILEASPNAVIYGWCHLRFYPRQF